MKKLVLALVGAALFMAANLTVSAQNYQPFRPGLTYHFSAQDTIYSLRTDAVNIVAGDSVFIFNPIARKGGTAAGPGCGGILPPRYAIHGNNIFGAQMRKTASGDYIFKTVQGQEYLLKTKAAIGQSWQFNTTANLTATLTSKTVESLASVSDSVLTFSLSNNKTIKLTKNYGFVSTPNFITYTDAFFQPKDLTFYALPERGLGHQISSPFAVFDFQPGDRFYYYLESLTGPQFSGVCSEEWTWREVLTRRNSPNGDTIYYTIQEQKISKGYGSAGAPMGWCQVPTATTVHPSRTYPLVVTKNFEPGTSSFSHGFYAPPMKKSNDGMVSDGIFKTSKFNYREQLSFINMPYDSCAKAFLFQVDFGHTRNYTVGLGHTLSTWGGYMGSATFELKAYVKGTETWGTWRSLGQIMAVQKALEPTALKAYPNPFTSEVTLQFSSSFSAGKASVSVSNVLGQEALKREITVLPGQENRLELGQLPKGMYVLKAEQNGKVFTTRLVKE